MYVASMECSTGLGTSCAKRVDRLGPRARDRIGNERWAQAGCLAVEAFPSFVHGVLFCWGVAIS